MSLLTENEENQPVKPFVEGWERVKYRWGGFMAEIVQPGIWNKAPARKRGKNGLRIDAITGKTVIDATTGLPVSDKRYEFRGANPYNLRKSDKELRWRIYCNFTNPAKAIMFTILFASDKSHKDIFAWNKEFVRRLQNVYGEDYGELLYVAVLEPNDNCQGYHLHTAVAFNNSAKPVEFNLKDRNEYEDTEATEKSKVETVVNPVQELANIPFTDFVRKHYLTGKTKLEDTTRIRDI